MTVNLIFYNILQGGYAHQATTPPSLYHIWASTLNVTGFEKTQLPRTITNNEFNYLFCYISGRNGASRMKFSTNL